MIGPPKKVTEYRVEATTNDMRVVVHRGPNQQTAEEIAERYASRVGVDSFVILSEETVLRKFDGKSEG